MKVRGIETAYPAPGVVLVRSQTFRWGQSLGYAGWIVIGLAWWFAASSWYFRSAGVLVAVAGPVMVYRASRAGIVALGATAVEAHELFRIHELPTVQVREFSTGSFPYNVRREHLSICLLDGEVELVRSISGPQRRAVNGTSEIRAAANSLNAVLRDLRSGEPA